FARSLRGRLQLSCNASQRLNVMTDLVGDDVGLREVSGNSESLIELPEEGQIEIHLAVGGAIERSHCGLAQATRRLRGVGEEDEHWGLVPPAALPKHSAPPCLR